ncbi:hypothetical protein ILUMI_04977 [Ignelater luminosus]|uniref:Mutator-like transposase domain-containing protein n=1 Tax=Ignelater luminosus TaxID=2038154 RepID=A0A8K0DIM0_IGNLU|nr:hypothetical protein ILUMI_04977 [Ignelater luminosus]
MGKDRLGESVKWCKVRSIRVDFQKPNVMQAKYEFEGDYFDIDITERSHRRLTSLIGSRKADLPYVLSKKLVNSSELVTDISMEISNNENSTDPTFNNQSNYSEGNDYYIESVDINECHSPRFPPTQESEKKLDTKAIIGNPINLKYFFDSLKTISEHGENTFGCALKNPETVTETQRELYSSVYLKCIMSIGGGFYNLEEFLLTFSIPCMSEKTYKGRHYVLSRGWEKVACEKMEEAAKREADYAKEHNIVDKNGIPCIIVVADGCWSKRSYKTNYNAFSGAALIVGLRKDIDNSFNHVFGDHKSGEEYSCLKQQEMNYIDDIKSCAAFHKLVITVKSISQYAHSLIYNRDKFERRRSKKVKKILAYRRKLKRTAMEKHKRSYQCISVFFQKPDMDEEEYNSRKKKCLDNLLSTEESRAKFEKDTILQSGSSI